MVRFTGASCLEELECTSNIDLRQQATGVQAR